MGGSGIYFFFSGKVASLEEDGLDGGCVLYRSVSESGGVRAGDERKETLIFISCAAAAGLKDDCQNDISKAEELV